AVGKFIDITPQLNKKNINFSFKLNKELMQQGNSSDMIFSFDTLIAHISTYFSINIGDLIFTGTPAGVGECVVGDDLEAFIENQSLLNLQIK
ncbi:MAG: fumarylacetoacetate hydrolase family protein, partial [Ginsengibacter sp.]